MIETKQSNKKYNNIDKENYKFEILSTNYNKILIRQNTNNNNNLLQ